MTGASAAMLKTLERRGLIARFRKEVLRTPYAAGADGPPPDAPLSERQAAVADAIDADARDFPHPPALRRNGQRQDARVL